MTGHLAVLDAQFAAVEQVIMCSALFSYSPAYYLDFPYRGSIVCKAARSPTEEARRNRDERSWPRAAWCIWDVGRHAVHDMSEAPIITPLQLLEACFRAGTDAHYQHCVHLLGPPRRAGGSIPMASSRRSCPVGCASAQRSQLWCG